jgi:hypothetical protein
MLQILLHWQLFRKQRLLVVYYGCVGVGYVILVAVSIMNPFLPRLYVSLLVGMMVPDILRIIRCLIVESADQVNAKYMEPSAKWFNVASAWGTCMPSVTSTGAVRVYS